MFNLIFLIVGVVAGILATYFVVKGKFGFSKSDETTISSHTMVERIERVFKIVTAEGHFSEIYDYTNTSHLFTIIPSTKKALVIVNAKVLMGYDFKKLKMEIDEESKQIKILEFPKAEILSIEPDLKYYNLENGLFNKFDNQDLTKLQAEAKQKITESVGKSDLPQIAEKQIQTLLLEMTSMNQYQIEDIELIHHENVKLLNAPKTQ